MTASLSKMTIDYYLRTAEGDGVSYDATSYYLSDKTPPGRWYGSGLEGLNINPGSAVARDDARTLFGDHADPATGEQLGRPVMTSRQMPADSRSWTGKQSKTTTHKGVHMYDLTFSPPKSISALWAMSEPGMQKQIYQAHQEAVAEALDWLEVNVVQTRSSRGGTVKTETRGIVASLFDHWDSRNGDPQLHTHAAILNKVQRAADGQWLSIDAAPLYKYTVAVSEKYNSLLFDRLHERVGAVAQQREGASLMTNEALLAATESGDADVQEVAWVGTTPRVELAGVPDALIEEFSTRARQIEARKDELIVQHRETTGREPSNKQILEYRQQATLESREAKDPEDEATLPIKMSKWKSRALAIGIPPEQVVRDATGHSAGVVTSAMVTDQVRAALSRWSLQDASMRRTTFSRANVVASAERVTRLIRCSDAQQRNELVESIVDQALEQAVMLSDKRFPTFEVDAAQHDPTMVLHGESVFDAHRTTGVYTTAAIIEEEEFLISQAESQTAPCVAEEQAQTVLGQWRSDEGYPLSEDQFAASRDVLTSQAGLSAIIGPAGTGKTTTMAAITDTWQAAHGEGSVVGLAPSAVAAGVLGDEIGVATENTAKWLYESVGEGAARRAQRAHAREQQLSRLLAEREQSRTNDPWRDRQISELRQTLALDHAEQAKYQLRENQLLIVDEASMVATPELAELAHQAQQAGAKVLLVGDPAQLEAVDAGGFLGHMDRNLEVSRLDQVWRFRNDWEKEASLRLRIGGEDAVDTYHAQGRIHGDADTDAADAAYQRWKADHDRFTEWNQQNPQEPAKTSILIASDNATVAALNQRAHADRVAAGEVSIEQTVTVRGDQPAGVGEQLLARKNARSLRDSHGNFITNGTQLTIVGIYPDGGAEAVVASTGATVTLDKNYLADSVELGYAVTAHRAQGVTVETGHAVVSAELSRELFYVAMTRGKASNEAYVDFGATDEPAIAAWETPGDGAVVIHETPETDDPVEMVKSIVGRAQAERSAHEVRSAEHGWANDLGRMFHERTYMVWAARTTRTQQWLRENYSRADAERIFSDHDWQRLVSADPAMTHTGPTASTDTVASVLARCQRPTAAADGPGSMLTPVVAATQLQQQTLDILDAQLRDQLAIRAQEVRLHQPAWYQQLAQGYPDGQVPQKHLDAVLLWRAASDQTEAPTPLGSKPPQNDYLYPIWERMHATLSGSGAAHRAAADIPGPPAPESRHEDWQRTDAMMEGWPEQLTPESFLPDWDWGQTGAETDEIHPDDDPWPFGPPPPDPDPNGPSDPSGPGR